MKTIAVAMLLLTSVVSSVVSSQSDGWGRATKGYRFAFPRDHASHPDYKLEWWYYTGNVSASDGRLFGYQLTFFRIGVDRAPTNPSRWAIRDLFMAHLAISDVRNRQFSFAELLNRAGIGWAGAESERYRVWNENWEATLQPDGGHRLRASHGDIALDLQLEPGKGPVDQGVDGISQKGDGVGNASHYYSMTRMPTTGTLTVAGEPIQVRGLSWMDHEFGTSVLEQGQTGWNWFAIQLNDGTDLMLYEFRRGDDERDRHSSGSLIDEAGGRTRLGVGDFTLEAGAQWKSARSGASYPTNWQILIPAHGLDLRVQAVMPDQELAPRQSGVVYWEGAVVVQGTRRGQSVQGRGYLEMTGYAGSLTTRMLQ
ncbi:MAG: lipocalin-like domain-containing protein [Vicinamibacterales bacterium]